MALISRPTEHGALLIREGSQLIQIGSTLKCPHCGLHFESMPGSGKRRAWCHHCNAVCCSKVDGQDVMAGDSRPSPCDECYPEEKMLEDIERANKESMWV